MALLPAKEGMRFHPEEVLFSPSSRCNLSCPHCAISKSDKRLSLEAAKSFLSGCRALGVKRVGFTGGEPFLSPDFLCGITAHAVKKALLFGRIMTNGVWYRTRRELKSALERLRASGYDGSICVSVDAFHRQDLAKAAYFIKAALSAWNRPDMVSLASVVGGRDKMTEAKLEKLSGILGGRLTGFKGRHPCIRGRSFFIKIFKIPLAPVGRAARFKDPWDGRWFKEDHCEGPGNVFFVEPSGDVKPCCGYARDSDLLTIGNIARDSAKDIMGNVSKNPFVSAIFAEGLVRIRKTLECLRANFPGKTSSHCWLCDYIMTEVPRATLNKCLAVLKTVLITVSILAGMASFSFAGDFKLKAASDYRPIPAHVIKKITIPKWYHEGLFYDGKYIWVSNGEKGKTWVVDPSSGAVMSEITPVAGFTEAITQRQDNGAFFVTDWSDKKLYRVRIEGDKMVPEQSVSFAPAYPAGAVWNGERFFVVTWTRRIFGTKFDIIELDGEMNKVNRIAVGRIQEPTHLAWDGKFLWVTSWFSRIIYKVDVGSWTMTGYFRSPVMKTTGIVWDGKCLWVTGTHSDLYQVEVPPD